MKKLLTVLTLLAGMLAGSTMAVAATYDNRYDAMPEWAENAFIVQD